LRSRPAPPTRASGVDRIAPVTRETYDFKTLASDKPKFFVQGDLDDPCPLRTCAPLREAPRAERAGRRRRRQSPLRRQDRRSGEALEDLLVDFG
jgi:hypothetical protein